MVKIKRFFRAGFEGLFQEPGLFLVPALAGLFGVIMSIVVLHWQLIISYLTFRF